MFESGMDVSTLLEIEANNGKFYDFNQDKPEDLLVILKRHGVNSLRLRLWNDPYDENGRPYLAGTCDFERVIIIARRAVELGMNWMLDFHYSDFWVDPSKQTLPKAWNGLTQEELVNKVYQYTKDVLSKLVQLKIAPKYIQVGNEITNGMLWPYAHLDGSKAKYDNLAAFLKAGLKACKEVLPNAATILHLERSGNNALYRQWLKEIIDIRQVDFDILGVSYYSYWHGSLADLAFNLKDIRQKYQKNIMIVETSYAFTLKPSENCKLVIGEASYELLEKKPDYPISIAGQEAFLDDLFNLAKELDLKGIYYWEPAWLPVKNTSWASVEARQYIHEADKDGGNEWANQALFSYDGLALPALKNYGRKI